MAVAELSDDEPEWIRRFQAGDAEGYWKLYLQYDPLLRPFVLGRTPRGCDGDEWADAIWEKIRQNYASFENKSFRAWMLQIARNYLTDRYRQQGRRPPFENLGEREIAVVAREVETDRIKALRECLKTLAGDFVNVLNLSVEGLKAEAIAQQLRIAEGTVYSRSSRGKVELKDCIEQKLK